MEYVRYKSKLCVWVWLQQLWHGCGIFLRCDLSSFPIQQHVHYWMDQSIEKQYDYMKHMLSYLPILAIHSYIIQTVVGHWTSMIRCSIDVGFAPTTKKAWSFRFFRTILSNESFKDKCKCSAMFVNRKKHSHFETYRFFVFEWIFARLSILAILSKKKTDECIEREVDKYWYICVVWHPLYWYTHI